MPPKYVIPDSALWISAKSKWVYYRPNGHPIPRHKVHPDYRIWC